MPTIDERARFALLTNIYACDTFSLLGNLSIVPGAMLLTGGVFVVSVMIIVLPVLPWNECLDWV
jgi:hypothetical protein